MNPLANESQTPKVSQDDIPSISELGRIQSTLLQRWRGLDPENLIGIGFGTKQVDGQSTDAFSIRILVKRKQKSPPKQRRFPESVTARCLQDCGTRFLSYRIATDIEQAHPPRLSGTDIITAPDVGNSLSSRATVTTVVGWKKGNDQRWGLISVGHFLGSRRTKKVPDTVVIERVTACSGQPATIEGTIRLRGTRSNHPDASLIETTFDRLWLSGFIDTPKPKPLFIVDAEEVARWIPSDVTGYWYGNREVKQWRLDTYLPTLMIPGIGRVDHMLRFKIDDVSAPQSPSLIPGTSGASLIQGGRPLGMQIAAEAPRFNFGYAQLWWHILPFLKEKTNADSLSLLRVF